jgi:hypothetical protein
MVNSQLLFKHKKINYAGDVSVLYLLLFSHGGFLEGVYEIELDTKTEYGGF